MKSKTHSFKNTALTAALFASVSALALPVMAQTTEATPEAAPAEEVEVIVVTAQKRKEKILDVPISVTALNERLIEAKGLQSVADVTTTTPNVSYNDTTSIDPAILIRGISSASRNLGFESGLGLYVDGVYVGRSFAFDQSVDDVSRIEILRGPQGTLYGKNTTTGAMNLFTRRPGKLLEGQISVEAGDYGHKRIGGYISGPITSTLGGKISGFKEERDGLWKNINSKGTGNKEYRNADNFGYRGELRWQPREGIDISFRADKAEYNENVQFAEVNRAFCIAGTPPQACLTNLLPQSAFGVTGKPLVVDFDKPSTLKRELEGFSLAADFDVLNGHTLSYIGASRKTKSAQVALDSDSSPLDFVSATFFDKADFTSHEIRLTSPQDQKLTYIVGAYVFDQTATTDRDNIFGQDANNFLFGSSLVAPGVTLADVFRPAFPLPVKNTGTLETKAQAFFVSGEYDLTDTLTLTGGLRYTKEEKNLVAAQNGGLLNGLILGNLPTPNAAFLLPQLLPSVNTFTTKREDDDVSPTVGLNWKPNTDTLVYGRWARGFKSGGYNLDFLSFGQTLNSNPSAAGYNPLLLTRTVDLSKIVFEPEQLDNYEIGFKTRLLNRRLQLTAAMFLLDYSNIQLSQFDGRGFVPSNASAESKGFEVEFVWRASSNWSFDGGLGRTNAKYTKYDNPLPGVLSAAGEKLAAPEFSSNLGIQYDYKVESLAGALQARLDWYHQGLTPQKIGDPYSELPSFDNVNARLQFKSNYGWDVSVFVTNLLDSDHIVSQDTGRFLGVININQEFKATTDPRQVRARLAYRF
jgi:iron complex outermembrane recepter protein